MTVACTSSRKRSTGRGDEDRGLPSVEAVSDIFDEPYDKSEVTKRDPEDPPDDSDDDWGEGEEDPEEEENVAQKRAQKQVQSGDATARSRVEAPWKVLVRKGQHTS